MERFKYSEEEQKLIESSFVPFVVYQFLDERIIAIAITQGFMDLFKIPDRQTAYDVLNNDMYRTAHPDDVARIADASYRFGSWRTDRYKVIYRSKINGEYRIIRAWGEHLKKDTGEMLTACWYVDEGPYKGDDSLDAMDSIDRSLNLAIMESTRSYSASFDYLTGLPNMSHFFELAYAWKNRIDKEGKKAVMLYFDLSGMKMYNEKYGFSAGDELLRRVADVLKRHFSSDNCGRMSGDHFAAFATDENIDERLSAFLSDVEAINNGNNLPIRIGIYGSDQQAADASSACDRAKMACDTTKNSFVSSINYFDEKMLEMVELRQHIIGNFDRALSEGWIKVFHQPIVRASNGKVSDEEALARWEDPERGMIMPDVFVPILEDSRLIYKLDLYVAKQVIEKMKKIAAEGLHVVPESINLSKDDFYSCDVVEEIRKLVDDAGIDHSRITIEITESMVSSDVEFMRQQVERFRELGFEVWMDDYGSGYSSPEVLQHIHFDTLKFDMQFMREFDNNPANRIILTELVKMAIALGIETVVEGVETAQQVEFLKEIGANKLQGYYYLKPVPFDTIIERNREGIAIGFEDPEESEYYRDIENVSLYDMSVSAEDDEEYMKDYFNTMPMAIMEIDEKDMWVARANKPYKDFFDRNFHADASIPVHKSFEELESGRGSAFQKSMKQCAADGKRALLDERLPDGSIMHVFIRRVAVNPVTKVTALAVIILGITRQEKNALTYTYVAQALSSDYINLFYVDLDTEEFIEYGAGNTYDELAIERHGEDFFKRCRADAAGRIFPDDLETFMDGFSKERMAEVLKNNNAYTLTYRIINSAGPVYVHLKAVPIKDVGNKIIIGISNIDTQKKQQEIFDRIKEERITFSRIAALSGDFLYIFSVDPETWQYTNYISKGNIEDYGMHTSGDDFFADVTKSIASIIYIEDMELVRDAITKEKVLEHVKNEGIFSLNFRVVFSTGPVYVLFKAVMVEEKDGKHLIVGVNNVNDRIRREQEYVTKLTAARNEASRDALTGVKNKHAYIDVEAQIDRLIEEGNAPEFAVVVLDINDLKLINDTLGHQAGDEHIKAGCDIVCRIFRHCPVFRIGGDEFVIIAQGGDYNNIDILMRLLEESNMKNISSKGVVVAAGMARYRNEKRVSDVFDKADIAMYENKHRLKDLREI
ncbi:MAG: EAL domain-containing protein [Butyrivibrio sp.]|nr:EAL domain-containing protein [Butyrivibrio sp.]